MSSRRRFHPSTGLAHACDPRLVAGFRHSRRSRWSRPLSHPLIRHAIACERLKRTGEDWRGLDPPNHIYLSIDSGAVPNISGTNNVNVSTYICSTYRWASPTRTFSTPSPFTPTSRLTTARGQQTCYRQAGQECLLIVVF